jgi:hypothetical protein
MTNKRESGPKSVIIQIPSVTQVTVGTPDIDAVIASVLEGPFPSPGIDVDKAFDDKQRLSVSQRMSRAIRRLSQVISITKEKEMAKLELEIVPSEEILQVRSIHFIPPDIDAVVQKENIPIESEDQNNPAKDIDDIVNRYKE